MHQNGRQRQKHHDPARDLSIQVLEKFSLVTRFARETTSQLFRENHLVDGFTPIDVKKHGQSSTAYDHILASNDSPKVPDKVPSNESPKVLDDVSVPSDPVEVKYLLIVKWRKCTVETCTSYLVIKQLLYYHIVRLFTLISYVYDFKSCWYLPFLVCDESMFLGLHVLKYIDFSSSHGSLINCRWYGENRVSHH